MANRKEIISGTIMEIPLEKNFGYGYVKLIFAGDILSGKTEFIAKIYNLYRKNSCPKEEFKPREFETDDLFLYPLLMIGYPRLRGDAKWRYMGLSSLTEEDKVIPDYRMDRLFRGSTLEELENDCRFSSFGCAIVRKLMKDPGLSFTRDFDSIKHIWRWSHYASTGIRTIASLFWMREFRVDPLTKYSKEELEKGYWTLVKQVENYGVDFRSVKRANRLHATIGM